MSFRSIIVLLSLVGAAACSDDPTDTGPVATRVEIISPASDITVDDSLLASARAYDAQGATLNGVHFSWSSSNPAVVSVDSTGLLRARSAGTAEIRATTSSNVTGTRALTVRTRVARLSVTSIGDLIVGETSKLAVRAYDARDTLIAAPQLTWSTSNSAVATVDSTGTVRGTGYGVATITARASATVIVNLQVAVGTFRLTPVALAKVVDVMGMVPSNGSTNNAFGGSSCALAMGGAVQCWGYPGPWLVPGYAYPATSEQLIPVQILPPANFKSIEIGDSHTCALAGDGTVWCWGDGYAPAPIASALRFKSISVAGSTNCGVDTDGGVYCWGSGAYGHFGDGRSGFDVVSNTPTRVPLPEVMVAVAIGNTHACALAVSGNVFCWGMVGPALGGGEWALTGADIVARTPRLVSGNIKFARIDAGWSPVFRDGATCGITAIGRAYCWGGTGYESGIYGNVPTPVNGVNVTVPFTDISASVWQSCATTTDGTAYCWTAGNSPSSPMSSSIHFAAVAASNSHACGISMTGAGYCWGSAMKGQLGNGRSLQESNPVAVAGGLQFTSLASFNSDPYFGTATCGLTADGTAYCWGPNDNGQLGDGTRTDRFAPTRVNTAVRFSALSAAGMYACALDLAGAPYCWGSPNYETVLTTPAKVTSSAAFTQIATGVSHACGLTAGGAAYCWGQNNFGQLGTGNHDSSPVAVAVVGGIRFTRIAATDSYTCGVSVSNTVYCWGGAGDPALFGRATGTAQCGGWSIYYSEPCSSTPLEVPSTTDAVDIGINGRTRCYLNTGGTLYCWGENFFQGQEYCTVGGKYGSRCDFTPVRLEYTRRITRLVKTVGLADDGTLLVITANNLSGPAPLASYKMTAAPGSLRYASASGGLCGVSLDGPTYCWGPDDHGQLGDGPPPDPNTPQAVIAASVFLTAR